MKRQNRSTDFYKVNYATKFQPIRKICYRSNFPKCQLRTIPLPEKISLHIPKSSLYQSLLTKVGSFRRVTKKLLPISFITINNVLNTGIHFPLYQKPIFAGTLKVWSAVT